MLVSPSDLETISQALKVNAEQADTLGYSTGASGLQILRDARLMGLVIPKEYGGGGGTIEDVLVLGRAFGGCSLSTAIVWVMHCQQVRAIVEHAREPWRGEILSRIAANQYYVASITTEAARNSRILDSSSPITVANDGDAWQIEREAPVVSAGTEADGFLVTMKRGPEAKDNDVVLVYVDRQDANVEAITCLQMLGMRATGNVSLRLTATVKPSQVIDPAGGFGEMAMQTLIPWAHIGWSACWLGAAEAAFREFVHLVRSPEGRRLIGDIGDLFHERLARVRCSIDISQSLLLHAAAEYTRVRSSIRDPFESTQFQILINNLKVVVAEESFRAVDLLINLAGLRVGYQANSLLALERVFRDVRSASLTYNNDRLLLASGRLALLETR
jgi:acyl-CoA dehydrogenase